MTDVTDLDMTAMMNEPLHPDLEPHLTDGPLGRMLHHPLVVEIFPIPGIANRVYEHKRTKVAEAEAAGDWDRYIALHERPYRLLTLARLFAERIIDRRQLRALLPGWWSDAEPSDELEWLPLWKKAAFATDDIDAWAALPDELTIYRGGSMDDPLAQAWSLNEKIAVFFARRWMQPGDVPVVHTAKARKVDALGFITDRGEAEVIIEPKKVRDVRTKRVTP